MMATETPDAEAAAHERLLGEQPLVESLSTRSVAGLVLSVSVAAMVPSYSSSSRIFSAPVSSRCALSARLLSSLMRRRISFFESALRSASS